MWVNHMLLLTCVRPLLGPSFGLLHHTQLRPHGVIDLKTLLPRTGILQITIMICKEVLLFQAIPKLGQVLHQIYQHRATVLHMLHLIKATQFRITTPRITQPAFMATPTAILHPSKLHQIKIQVLHISPLFRIQSVILLLLLL